MESAGIATSTGSPVAVESATAESKVSFMGVTIGEPENRVKRKIKNLFEREVKSGDLFRKTGKNF